MVSRPGRGVSAATLAAWAVVLSAASAAQATAEAMLPHTPEVGAAFSAKERDAGQQRLTRPTGQETTDHLPGDPHGGSASSAATVPSERDWPGVVARQSGFTTNERPPREQRLVTRTDLPPPVR